MSKTKTIEELSISKTGRDLWDEFNENPDNPNSRLLMLNNFRVDVRLIGPFVNVSRFYSPILRHKDLEGFQENVDIESIANKNFTAIEKAKVYLKKHFKDGITIRSFDREDRSERYGILWGQQGLQGLPITSNKANKISVDEYFNQIEKTVTWQKCIMSNVFIKSVSDGSRIKIIVITRNIYDSIVAEYKAVNNLNRTISGLFAGDLSITKTGERKQSKYQVKVNNPTPLNDIEINHIISRGLIDIPTLINEININKNSSYYYKKNSDYRMGSTFMKEILCDASNVIEKEHFANIDENLHNIPKDAFENVRNINNAIIGLDL